MDNNERNQSRQLITNMGNHYDYDVSYMLYLLDHSDHGFAAINHITDIHSSLSHVSFNAGFTARLMGLKQEDCGPCLQLTIHMAREVNMAVEQISAVLKGDESAMDNDVALAYRFAASVLAQSPDADQHRSQIQEKWGDQGVIELTLALHVVRLYPQIKRALGFDSTCQHLQVGQEIIEH